MGNSIDFSFGDAAAAKSKAPYGEFPPIVHCFINPFCGSVFNFKYFVIHFVYCYIFYYFVAAFFSVSFWSKKGV